MHAVSQDLKRQPVPGEVAPIQNPLRIATESKAHKTLFMPSRLTTSQGVSATTCKIVAVPKPSTTIPGLPASTVVLDEVTGSLAAVVNAGELTGLRTSAASALATKLLASPNSTTLVTFGSGTQAYYHTRLVLELFPSVVSASVIVRSITERSKALIQKLVSEFSQVEFKLVESKDHESLVQNADIINTCVPSTSPLFKENDLKEGVHINAIGSYTPTMQEFPPSLIAPGSTSSVHIPTILVDSRDACLHEAGELIAAKIPATSLVELGDVVSAEGEAVADIEKYGLRRSGRSLFKCVGVGAMDVAITKLVVEMAKTMNIGTEVPY
ncbi:NAD(P)-binding protein [Meredithblackwellia eburnea MCA 4105]